MPKRKLSKHQQRRIKNRRDAKAISTAKLSDEQEAQLGHLQNGRVMSSYGHQVLIESEDRSVKQRCFSRANLSLVCGDFVQWRQGHDEGVVEHQLQRTSALTRPDSYGNMRTIAANIDQLLITVAARPEAHANLIDRYIIAARLQNIEPVLVFNKQDIEPTPKILELSKCYHSLGLKSLSCSSKTGAGISELESLLQDKTSIFVGQSGVGKSSLLQYLMPSEEIEIGELSHASAKGRHTTTQASLYHFKNGGECIDSPGIREFGLWHIEKEDVMLGFPDIEKFAQSCKFRDCAHKNDQGCEVQAAIERKELSEQRFESYKIIVEQLGDVHIKQH
jgi:ribosome biogenesis GTPase